MSALEPNTAGFTLPSYTIGYDAANRPVTRGDGQSYTYNARGNLNAIQGSRNVTFGYDAFGRLRNLAGDAAAFYGYDATGLRATRNDRRYVWDVSGARPRLVAAMRTAGPALLALGLLIYGGFQATNADGPTIAVWVFGLVVIAIGGALNKCQCLFPITQPCICLAEVAADLIGICRLLR